MMKTVSLAAILLSVYVALVAAHPDCHGGGGLKGIPQDAQILILEPPSHRAAENQVDGAAVEVKKQCRKNEMFTACKADCPVYCDLETGTVHQPYDCTGKCVAGCSCKKGYVRPPLEAPFKECISLATCKGLFEAASQEQEE